MDSLSKIFGGSARVKIMRLFLFNAEETFDGDDIAERAKVSKRVASSELRILEKAELLKKKRFVKTIIKKFKTKTKKSKKRTDGYALNENFKYLLPLESLLIKGEPLGRDGIEKRFNKSGSIKLLLVSGVFINNKDSRVDILIVGDKLNQRNIESAIKAIETEIGTELRYAVFETKEFIYRTNVYDKLIRDILESPHEKIIEKIKI